MIEREQLATQGPLAAALTMFAFVLAKSASGAAVLSNQQGFRILPIAFLTIAVLSVPFGLLHVALMRRWGRRSTRIWVLVVVAAFLVVCSQVIDSLLGAALLFVAAPVAFAAVLAGVWLLVGEVADQGAQAARASRYFQAAAGSSAGGLAGGLGAALLPRLMPRQGLLLIAALCLVVTALVARSVHRSLSRSARGPRVGRRTPTGGHPLLTSRRQLLREPLVRLLASISAVAALSSVLIEFQFFASAVTVSGPTIQFFGGYFAATNLLALLLQLFVGPRLQARLGLVGELAVLPSALLLLSGGAGLLQLSAPSVLLRGTEQSLKASLHRVAWEQTLGPFSAERRDPAKALVDGLVGRLAEAVGAIGLIFWLHARRRDAPDLNGLLAVVVALLVAWLVLTYRLRAVGCPATGSDPSARLAESCPFASAMGQHTRL